jgi:transcriptional regulator with XRE-family HTH domain
VTAVYVPRATIERMSTRERPADRGSRRGRELLDQLIREFHESRVSAGVSQRVIARAIGRSDAWVSWTETGENASLSIVDASRMLSCVGLELAARAYPAGRGIRDEAQLALIARLKAFASSRWEWRTEVPIPLAGDPRAWDVVLRRPRVSVGVEAETKLRDMQAIDRRVMLKLRDSGLDRAIILVSPTRTNRTTLRDVGESLRTNYPVSSRQALDALVNGRDPGGNAILVLGGHSTSPAASVTPAGLAQRESGADSSQVGVGNQSQSDVGR